jgi:hypothetical protein
MADIRLAVPVSVSTLEHGSSGQHVVRRGLTMLFAVRFTFAFVLFGPLAILGDQTLATGQVRAFVFFKKTTFI